MSRIQSERNFHPVLVDGEDVRHPRYRNRYDFDDYDEWNDYYGWIFGDEGPRERMQWDWYNNLYPDDPYKAMPPMEWRVKSVAADKIQRVARRMVTKKKAAKLAWVRYSRRLAVPRMDVVKHIMDYAFK